MGFACDRLPANSHPDRPLFDRLTMSALTLPCRCWHFFAATARLLLGRLLLGLVFAAALVPAALAEPRQDTSEVRHAQIHPPVALTLFNRNIAELRGNLGGLDPQLRTKRASEAFFSLSNEELKQRLDMLPMSLDEGSGYTFIVDGRPLFTLLVTDLDPEARQTLLEAAEQVRARLRDALAARLEQGSLASLLKGGSILLAVLFTGVIGVWSALQSYGFLVRRANAVSADAHPLTYLRVLALRLSSGAVWLLLGGLLYGCAVVLLDAFPFTRPWGGELAGFVTGLGGWLITGVMGAVPGLITVTLIMIVARTLQDVLGLFLTNVQDGVIRVPFMHAETVSATRRLMTILVWGVALAVAYPYLPGSSSDAFKSLSVLFGLMLTLGSAGLMTQLMSGLVVVYSRSLQKGDVIQVNQIEGVVSEVGALAVKVVTVRNEEITIPNGVITGSPIRNFSRLNEGQGTLLSTRVTIGYDAPWRQVHAMLVAAALNTPGIRAKPEPYVFQRALSDFYVEYELFANIEVANQRFATLSNLLAEIQDEFNRNGVQILSPHFVLQPDQPVVVPPALWNPPLAPPHADGGR